MDYPYPSADVVIEEQEKQLRWLTRRLAKADAVIEKCEMALAFYAEPSDWTECLAYGNVGSAKDGEPFMAFDNGEDAPWMVAEDHMNAIMDYRNEASK